MFIKNKFSTYIWKMRFFTLCIVALLLSSCHKKDKTYPLLSSQLSSIGIPNYAYDDTVYVESEGWAQDEFGLQSIQFTIQDLNAKVWYQKSISFTQNTSAWSGLVALPLNNRYMPSGDYYVKVVLDDGTYATNKILSFSYIECPISRTHLFLCNADLNQPIENWTNPSSPQPWMIGSDVQAKFSDAYHQLIWTHQISTPVVQAYVPMGNTPEWTSSTASLSPIRQMITDPQHLGAWVLSDDGGIELINEKGIRVKNAVETHTKEIAFHDGFIALSQLPPGNPAQVVIKNKDTWGHHHTWVHGKNTIQVFSWSKYIGIVYLENSIYKIALLNMENLLAVNWHPLQQQNWNSPPKTLTTENELWVAGDGTINAYNESGEIIMGPHQASPTYWMKSNYDQSIWMIENGQVIQIHPITGQALWTSPGNNYDQVLEMTNK